jgi:uncharacterized protein (TIGR03067 family)
MRFFALIVSFMAVTCISLTMSGTSLRAGEKPSNGLVGQWESICVIKSGNHLMEKAGNVWVFTTDRLAAVATDAPQSEALNEPGMKYTVDQSRTPRHITFIGSGDRDTFASSLNLDPMSEIGGIYSIHKDVLLICFDALPISAGGSRPEGFDALAKSNRYLVVLKKRR